MTIVDLGYLAAIMSAIAFVVSTAIIIVIDGGPRQVDWECWRRTVLPYCGCILIVGIILFALGR